MATLVAQWDRVFLAAIGSPEKREIHTVKVDGLHSTSRVERPHLLGGVHDDRSP